MNSPTRTINRRKISAKRGKQPSPLGVGLVEKITSFGSEKVRSNRINDKCQSVSIEKKVV
jgi:hypothetical protein